jgi:hypothetical protein
MYSFDHMLMAGASWSLIRGFHPLLIRSCITDISR